MPRRGAARKRFYTHCVDGLWYICRTGGGHVTTSDTYGSIYEVIERKWWMSKANATAFPSKEAAESALAVALITGDI